MQRQQQRDFKVSITSQFYSITEGKNEHSDQTLLWCELFKERERELYRKHVKTQQVCFVLGKFNCQIVVRSIVPGYTAALALAERIRPVLFLHAWSGTLVSSWTWAKFLHPFHKAGMSPITMDLPGFGKSAINGKFLVPTSEWAQFDWLIAMKTVLETLPVKPRLQVVTVGESCMTAIRLIDKYHGGLAVEQIWHNPVFDYKCIFPDMVVPGGGPPRVSYRKAVHDLLKEHKQRIWATYDESISTEDLDDLQWLARHCREKFAVTKVTSNHICEVQAGCNIPIQVLYPGRLLRRAWIGYLQGEIDMPADELPQPESPVSPNLSSPTSQSLSTGRSSEFASQMCTPVSGDVNRHYFGGEFSSPQMSTLMSRGGSCKLPAGELSPQTCTPVSRSVSQLPGNDVPMPMSRGGSRLLPGLERPPSQMGATMTRVPTVQFSERPPSQMGTVLPRGPSVQLADQSGMIGAAGQMLDQAGSVMWALPASRRPPSMQGSLQVPVRGNTSLMRSSQTALLPSAGVTASAPVLLQTGPQVAADRPETASASEPLPRLDQYDFGAGRAPSRGGMDSSSRSTITTNSVRSWSDVAHQRIKDDPRKRRERILVNVPEEKSIVKLVGPEYMIMKDCEAPPLPADTDLAEAERLALEDALDLSMRTLRAAKYRQRRENKDMSSTTITAKRNKFAVRDVRRQSMNLEKDLLTSMSM